MRGRELWSWCLDPLRSTERRGINSQQRTSNTYEIKEKNQFTEIQSDRIISYEILLRPPKHTATRNLRHRKLYPVYHAPQWRKSSHLLYEIGNLVRRNLTPTAFAQLTYANLCISIPPTSLLQETESCSFWNTISDMKTPTPNHQPGIRNQSTRMKHALKHGIKKREVLI